MNKFKKSLLATAITLTAASVSANVDIDASPAATTFQYATETTIESTGTLVDVNDGTITVNIGNVIPASGTRYVKLTFTDATFAGAPSIGDVAYNNADATTAAATFATITVEDGATGTSSVVYGVTETGATNQADANDELVFTLTNNLNLTSESSVTVKYEFFTTQAAALAGTGASISKSATLLEFAGSAFTFANDKDNMTATKLIDVTNGANQFVDGTAAEVNYISIGKISQTDDSATRDNIANTGAALTLDGIYTTSTLTVSATNGGFSATQNVDANGNELGTYDQTGTTFGDVYIDADGGCNSADYVAGAGTITADQAVFSFVDNALDTTVITAAEICMRVNGTTIIPEATFSATLTATGDTGYDNLNVNLGDFRTLDKNGSTASFDYVLTPNGAFNQYFRIVNDSSVTGNVSVTLTNDAGETSVVALSDVVDQTGSVTGGHSTDLIPLDDIYAVANGNGFDHNNGKLRAEFEAEWGSGNLKVQAVAVTGDNDDYQLLLVN